MRIDAHVQDICRKAYIDVVCISSICHLLSIDATKTLLGAFVLPKLDYCNSLCYGSPMYMLKRLLKVQNSAARLTFQCRKQNHISPILMSLHWQPINARIEYKLSVIFHSFFIGLSPIYLSELLSVYTRKINLRTSSNRILLSLNCEQRQLCIAHFLLQPPQYGILCLQNSDILIIFRNLGQHKKLILLGNSIYDKKKKIDLDLNHYIRSTSTCVIMRDCESMTCENYYFISFIYIFTFAVIH